MHLIGTITILLGEERALKQGIARETARTLVDWAFGARGLAKIAARVVEINRISSAWLGARMIIEGRLREDVRLSDGGRADVLRPSCARCGLGI